MTLKAIALLSYVATALIQTVNFTVCRALKALHVSWMWLMPLVADNAERFTSFTALDRHCRFDAHGAEKFAEHNCQASHYKWVDAVYNLNIVLI